MGSKDQTAASFATPGSFGDEARSFCTYLEQGTLAYSWAASSGLPTGPGLKLGDARGDSLRLTIDGCQFSDHEDPRMRDSWYMVEGSATAEGQEWGFRWQGLTCDTAPLIVGWLLQLADWVATASGDESPKHPWSIEPNLQFPATRVVKAAIDFAESIARYPVAPGASTPVVRDDG